MAQPPWAVDGKRSMKIVVTGYFGHQNLGDESILFAVASALKGHEVTVVSLDPPRTERLHGLPAVAFFDVEALEHTIAACDMVIAAAGGAYQEIPGIAYYHVTAAQFFSNPYGYPEGKVSAYGIVPLLASFYHKVLVFLANGLGPFYSQAMKHFCSFLLTSADLITVRDHYSLKWAQHLAPHSNVHLAADAAFVMRPQQNQEVLRLLSKYGLKSKQFLVLSLRELVDAGRQDKTVSEMAAVLSNMPVELKDLKILFVPFQNLESDYPVTDSNLAVELLEKIEGGMRDRLVVCDDQLTPQTALDLIGHARFGIGMRYHFLLFCILNEIPVISISYDNKCTSLMNDAGIPDLAADIPDLDAALIGSAMRSVVNGYAHYCELIRSRKIDLQKRARLSFDLLDDLLEKSSAQRLPHQAARKQERQGFLCEKGPYASLDVKSLVAGLQREREQSEHKQQRIEILEREIEEIASVLQTDLNDNKAAVAGLHVEVEGMKQENNELKGTIQKLHNELVSAKNELNLIHRSMTWRLGQMYGKFLFNTSANRFIENLFNRLLSFRSHADRHDRDSNPQEQGRVASRLKALSQLIQSRVQKGIFIVASTFPFDEFYNQRAINLSKCLAKQGNCVIYIAWRWSPSDQLPGTCEEVYENIFQVPIDYFLEHPVALTNLSHAHKWFIIEFPHPSFYPIMLQMKHNGYGILYDIIDHWKEFNATGQAPWFRPEHERAILMNADVVTAVSPPLIKYFSDLREDIQLMRNGFSQDLIGMKPELVSKKPDEPICIGYFGHLTESWFDWDFIFKMAQRVSDFHFHLIGYGESAETRSKAARFFNIELIGRVHPSSLSQHVTGWDVAIIPFLPTLLSESVDPIKIYEYLYFGLPVMVRGISHLEGFPYVDVGSSVTEAEQAVRRLACLKRSGGMNRSILDDFLTQCTWEERFKLLPDQLRCGPL